LQEDWWKPTILLYAGLVNPTKLIREAMSQKEFTLAYNCIQETRKQIDEVKAEFRQITNAGSKGSHITFSEVAEQVNDARYADLERYLKNGQWKEADNETYRLMITEVGKEEGQWFEREDLLNFPCEPLMAIDGLWVKHSGGKFGFSVQKKMYVEECGGVPNGRYDIKAWNKLCEINGWNRKIRYDTILRGHLPTGASPLGGGILRAFVWSCGLVSRIQTCEL